MANIKGRLIKLEQASGGDFDTWLKQASPEEIEAELRKELNLPEQASRQEIDTEIKKVFGLPADIELTDSVIAEIKAKARRSPNFG